MSNAMRATGNNFNQGGVPGTAARNNIGSRLGTGLQNPVGGLKNVNVKERPLSKGGLSGVGGGQMGSRNVQDRKYFLVLIKNKNAELRSEIEKFQKQTEQITTDNVSFMTLKKKYENLIKEVRELEGTLADYNLAVDKARAGTRPEDLRNMYEHVKNQNDKIRAHLDALFIERKSQEEQIGAIESQLQEIHQAAQMKLNELDPEQKADYESLVNENRILIGNINIRRGELEEINAALAQSEAKLRLDHTKQRYIQLKEQSTVLSRKKEDLEVQTNENNLSFPEARDRLLAKVKEDNNLMTNTDKRIKEIKQLISNYEKQLKEMAQEGEDAKNDEEEQKKYEVLYQKGKEMTDFIDNFEATRKEELQEMARIERNIVDLLENTSNILQQAEGPYTVDDFMNMQKELGFKEGQLGEAQATLGALQREYDLRVAELRNFESVEQKLEIEMKVSSEKMVFMQAEIDKKFNRISEVISDKEKRRQKLIKDRDSLLKMKVSIDNELSSVTYDYELKKQKLSLHEQYAAFNELEKKFALNESTIYNLKQFIQARTGDMNYQNLKSQCLDLVTEVNNILIKSM